MTYLPQYYFGDIPAEQMKEIVDSMDVSGGDLTLALCESRSHKEHRGELWQCLECLRLICWEEGTGDANGGLCDDCWCRLRERRHAVAFA
jgi:hypothetical protein